MPSSQLSHKLINNLINNNKEDYYIGIRSEIENILLNFARGVSIFQREVVVL